VEDPDGNIWGISTQPAGIFTFPIGGGNVVMAYENPCSGNCRPNSLAILNGGPVWTSLAGPSDNENCNGGCGTIGGPNGILYEFCLQAGCPDGSNPLALVQGSNGNLYGVAGSGGANSTCNISYGPGCGTLFELSATGPPYTLTTLYNFCSQENCADGYAPSTIMQVASSETFYGTTAGSTECANSASGCVLFSLSSLSGGLSWSPASLNFGRQGFYETSAPKTVTLTNRTGSTLYLTSEILAPTAYFTMFANNCGASLAPKASCAVSVTFTPNELGSETGTLSVSDSALNSPQTVALTGTGITPATLTPTGTNFNTHHVGSTSSARTFTLINHQSVTLTGITIAATGPFSVASTTCTSTLPMDSKCTISVTFSPTQTGPASGVLSVADSGGNSPQDSTLLGAGE
jgi:hypothetical protein